MNRFALIMALISGFVVGFGLENADVNVFASVIIAVAVAHTWYQLLKPAEITLSKKRRENKHENTIS